jgi:putative FmdB family regulatory protein
MPIYEYECLACGKRTEAIQKMDDPPIAACPACGGEVKKLISSPAFQFKGSGWYVTDYGGKKGPEGKSEHKAEGKGESKSEGGEGKSESKTEKAAATESKGSGSGSGSSGGSSSSGSSGSSSGSSE